MVRILLALVSLSISLPCLGSTPEKIEETHLKAEQGDAPAQFMLGFMYDYGAGVVEVYKGKPRIVIESGAQLTLIQRR